MSSREDCPDPEAWRAYCEGTVDESVRVVLANHLQQCQACAVAFHALEATILEGATGVAVRLPGVGQSTWTRFSEPAAVVDNERDVSAIHALSLEKPQNPTAIGRLGKYDILGVLGHGGMGVVLRGYDAELRREVAIKTLNNALSASSVAKRRFMREARAAAAINHPHVVTIYSVDQHREIPFIVMEVVRGPTLAEEIRMLGRLDPIRVVRIAAQIASGLAAAHAQGVIHRDIKPGNVMLEYDVDRCKITDFGLARATIDNVELTSREMGVGTPAYMSPEQVTGGEIDGRSDLFAQGCVMYAMLIGHSPFHGRNALEIIRLVERCSPPELRAVDSSIPEFLSAIVTRLLRKDPHERFQSAAELADVLNRHLAMINQTKSDKQGRIPLTPPLTVSPARRATGIRPLAALAIASLCIVTSAVGWMLWDLSKKPFAPDIVTPAATLVTVSLTGKADFSTISAALQSARAGTVILVADSATYTESVTLNANNITLRSNRQAVIRAPEVDSGSVSHAVVIRDCHDVVLEGFRVEMGSQGHAIFLHGEIGNILLRNLSISQPMPGAEHPTVQFSGHRGAADHGPVTLAECEIGSSKFPCLWLENHTTPTMIQDCVFLPTETALGVWGACGDMEMSGCVVRGGISCVNAVVQDWSAAKRIAVFNNTCDGTANFLGIHSLVPESVQLVIVNNLILDGRGVEIADAVLADLERREGFRGNFWQVPPDTPWSPETIGRIATQLSGERNRVPRDSQRPDYLTPPADSVLATAGVGGGFPTHVGANPPAAR